MYSGLQVETAAAAKNITQLGRLMELLAQGVWGSLGPAMWPPFWGLGCKL
jgi:hypothetical protein